AVPASQRRRSRSRVWSTSVQAGHATTLTGMAQLTGGRAAASTGPGDPAGVMAEIFLAAHAPR
ncbi:hypothetical protein ABZS66_14420, partial [Dactylosporangium sp. NPDC005572]|uniref:hypothetical protein n=1 Tax=Dactylosporangium sp. NPDC005572 TaxID=3156889 RepID=UPI0033A4A8E1